MTEREAQIEALWIYEISREKILKRIVNKGLMTQAEADGLSERMLWTAEHWQNSRFLLISSWWKDAYQWLMPHPLCFLNENCQRKENLQSKLPHPKLDEEQYDGWISADVGENLQSRIPRRYLWWPNPHSTLNQHYTNTFVVDQYHPRDRNEDKSW